MEGGEEAVEEGHGRERRRREKGIMRKTMGHAFCVNVVPRQTWPSGPNPPSHHAAMSALEPSHAPPSFGACFVGLRILASAPMVSQLGSELAGVGFNS